MTIHYTTLTSTFGDLLLTDHGAGLSGVYFPGHRRGAVVTETWVHAPDVFVEVARQLDAYLTGDLDAFDLSLDPRGTDGQRAVWAALRTIPRGATTTYGALAADIGRPGAARAVAGAVARNPISIVVPCHRVVGADATLTGYAGGIDRKRWLLALEGAPIAGLPLDATLTRSRAVP